MSKLQERLTRYSIPEVPHLPKGKICVVWRLPPERKTKSGIHIPDVWTAKDADGNEFAVKKEPVLRGVLVAAGLAARDELKDALFEIGDIVHFGKYAGSDIDAQRDPENASRTFTVMKVEDIQGSEDAAERLSSSYVIEYDEETGQHFYEPKKSKRKAA